MAVVHSKYKFTEQQREEQVEDDLAAGYSIPMILTAIIIYGLLSMVVSVWIAL